ncbi:MAG TPA: Rrf2 family transcriptional regulator [Syntrophomonadaceae bacterium]|nr:Rrf2 family transcriptional regulator [Syntrophomonadaceae bacterium]HOQ09423.1 Rrf2 family transcriptional regulator [Syntrophomonadaceae bacterium]HPU48307.1 Rrf2 family transcriptional regulator [Syntrophomonadaceae bacterium]
MRFSTKGRYGLRAMIEIASRQHEGPVPTHVIAEHQDLSERYLEQLLTPLKQAGLVKSIRGAQGGYILGRDAADITAGDIIRVLEGPIAPVDCISEKYPQDCERSNRCPTREIWQRIRDSISEILDSYTLQDLVVKSRSMVRESELR